MNVLIIGGGGREHALAWKAAQSPLSETIFVAPGNAGSALEDSIENIDISATDIPALITFAKENNVGLTIVGPEAPLVLGVVDEFQANDLAIFGPTQAAAQLEGSKAFCKDFLARHKIPTAEYETFTEIAPAKAYIDEKGAPIVVKADGLAAGKGVIVAQTIDEAKDAVDDMLADNKFGDAGSRVVIEEFLSGEEASFIVMADNSDVLAMASSQDHKARDNGDKGPNTGGMGAYSPAPVVTPAMHQGILDDIIYPTVEGMIADGIPYSGFLYAGVMIDKNGKPKTLEFNCRFGDPETQPIMMRLESDLVAHCLAAIKGTLKDETAQWSSKSSVGIVQAAGGYPFDYDKGDVISGITDAEVNGAKVFHAGTKSVDGDIVTAGGRVLCTVALGDSVSEAQERAYEAVNKISWKNVYLRTDIAYRAIEREKQS